MTNWKNIFRVWGVIILHIIWQYIANKNNWTIKPSLLLDYIRGKWLICSEWIGVTFARLSSYLLYIDLHEIFDYIYGELREFALATYDVISPIADIILSPLYIVGYYCKQASEYKYPILVVIGSIIGMGIICGIIRYFRHNSWKDLVDKIKSYTTKKAPVEVDARRSRSPARK